MGDVGGGGVLWLTGWKAEENLRLHEFLMTCDEEGVMRKG